jgi:hypothetical protein
MFQRGFTIVPMINPETQSTPVIEEAELYLYPVSGCFYSMTGAQNRMMKGH